MCKNPNLSDSSQSVPPNTDATQPTTALPTPEVLQSQELPASTTDHPQEPEVVASAATRLKEAVIKRGETLVFQFLPEMELL